MILPNSTPAKILVDQCSYEELLRSAQAALDLLRDIQEKTEGTPFNEPWPEIDDLEQAIADNL